jgi:hypothetical protein
MQIKPPQIGKTYLSRTDPDLLIYVVDVTVPDPDEDDDTPFRVEGCDPAYKDDIENADGLEFAADVWARHDFTLVPE